MPSSNYQNYESGCQRNDAEAYILDPNNGQAYKVRLRPVEGASKLEVRGYIGVPLLGRTQTWVRVE